MRACVLTTFPINSTINLWLDESNFTFLLFPTRISIHYTTRMQSLGKSAVFVDGLRIKRYSNRYRSRFCDRIYLLLKPRSILNHVPRY